MKLWFLSDLHLELFSHPDAFKPNILDFYILVCASDVIEGNCGDGFYYLRKLANDKLVVFVMGNYEFWNAPSPQKWRPLKS